MAAEGAPERVLVGSKQGGMTAADFLAHSRRAAAQFQAMGVEHVGVVDLNSEAVPLALFGAALAGVPFAPVNYRLPDDQLRSLVGRLAPGVVVVGPDVEARLADVEGVQVLTRDGFLDGVLADAGEVDLPFVDPGDVGVLLFTSGTTGHRTAFASADAEARKRLGSVGRALPTVELEIRGPDGNVLPAGERGEIYVRGEQIAGEYLGRSLLVEDGWFPTNDAGYLDDEGYL